MANDNFWLGVMIGNLFSKKGNNGEQKGGCLGKIIGILVIIGIGNLAIKYYGIKGILIPIAILIAAFALLVFLSIKMSYAKDTASFFLNLYNEGKYTQAIEYIEQEPKEKIKKVFKKYPDVALAAGISYRFGRGCDVNPHKAFAYFEKVKNKSNEAAGCYGAMLITGEGCNADAKTGIVYLKNAVVGNVPYACYEYGKLLFNGDFLEKNETDGKKFLRIASENGVQEATDFLNNIL